MTSDVVSDVRPTRFVFSFPHSVGTPSTSSTVDADGVRSSRARRLPCAEHVASSSLELVGEQVWPGALLMLHYMATVDATHVVELGSGAVFSSSPEVRSLKSTPIGQTTSRRSWRCSRIT